MFSTQEGKPKGKFQSRAIIRENDISMLILGYNEGPRPEDREREA